MLHRGMSTNPFARKYQHFLTEVAKHELTVLSDDGNGTRRLRVATPGTNVYSWEVVTWPGYLSIEGDIADGWTFKRADNMLDFFRVGERRYEDGAPNVSLNYWAEKVRGGRKTHEFSPRTFLGQVRDLIADHEDYGDAELEQAQAEGDQPWVDNIREQRQNTLDHALSVSDDEELAVAWLEEAAGQGLIPTEWWELDVEDYSTEFLLVCWALDKTVQLWDAR